MYQPYPASGPVPDPQPMAPPRSVLNAVRLMYAGAALELVAVIISVLTRANLKVAILVRHPLYSPAQVHHAETARAGPLVIGGVIAIGLWLWMAWANGRGRNWARVLSAVFFGISTFDLIISFALVHATVTMIVGVVIWLVGLGAIVLLFRKESAPFFRRPPARW
jgi:hypothetical protein